ncbi:MAG: hypothetical protein JSR56_04640 [Proteobacteria bacterium]|nr:hypothetical protein [Pseudomonadota bacterium]
MQRPSKRSILIGSGFFVVGFIVAIGLSSGLVVWQARQNWGATQAHIIGELTLNNSLLAAADKSPEKLTTTVIWLAQQNSELAAGLFGSMTKSHQAMVLRQFARMNQSSTLRADRSPRGNTALLARLMVLCSRESANPGVIRVDTDTTLFASIPDWVLEPGAEPIAPVARPDGPIKQTPQVLSAELKRWTELHQWVIANRDCVAKLEATR